MNLPAVSLGVIYRTVLLDNPQLSVCIVNNKDLKKGTVNNILKQAGLK